MNSVKNEYKILKPLQNFLKYLIFKFICGISINCLKVIYVLRRVTYSFLQVRKTMQQYIAKIALNREIQAMIWRGQFSFFLLSK
jgi:hypothetical protein